MNKGDKYVIEIAEVQKYHSEDGGEFELGRVKGFKALTLDESALKKLEPVRHGKWVNENITVAVCSCCEKVTMFETWGNIIRKYDYCPNCGAKMDGGKDYYDEHWEGEERRAHREWVEAIKCALDALKEQEHD